MIPERIRNNTWQLNVPGTELPKLERIPGLRIALPMRQSSELSMSGDIDAIAVAMHRLGLPPPEVPFGTVNVFPLGATEDLRGYQREGVDRCSRMLHRTGGAILADEMGLGKTRQAIAIAEIQSGPTLIVCPASVRETWRAELERCGYTPAIVRPKGKKETPPPDAQFVITSYELLDRALDLHFSGKTPVLLVIDEAQRISGRKLYTKKGAASRTKAVERIAACVPYKLALTGTLLNDRPRDLYRLLKILFGNRFGSAAEFDFAYCDGKEGAYGGIDNEGVSRADELKLRLSYYMVRREKKDVADELPKLTRQVIWQDAVKPATDAFSRWMLQKNPRGAFAATEATLNSKIQAVVEHAVTAKQFLLLTWMRSDARKIAKEIKAQGVPAYVITGAMTDAQKRRALTEAKAQNAGIVATIKSIGTGVDGLQHWISTGIMHAISHEHNQTLQAEARLDRIGQTKPVQWIYVALRDSMDEHVLSLNMPKMEAADAVVESAGLQSLKASFTPDEADMQALYDSLEDDE